MNVTQQLSFMKDGTRVLGSGDWFVNNDDAGSFCYSGIWQGGKVIALVLDEHSDSEVVKERGNLFVKAVNAHPKLVEVLKVIRELVEQDRHIPLVLVEAALLEAGEPV